MLKAKLTQIEALREELKGAYRFKNTEAMWNTTNRLLTVYSELADMLLEKQRNADTSDTVRPTVTRDVDVPEHSPVDFYSIDPDWYG